MGKIKESKCVSGAEIHKEFGLYILVMIQLLHAEALSLKFIGLQYILLTCSRFTQNQYFQLYKITSNVSIHFFHTIASLDILDWQSTHSISIYTSRNVYFLRTFHAAYKNPFFE